MLTVLHAASRRGHLEVVKLLLQRGADVNALDNANKTAAELALENDHADVAESIAEYKSDMNPRNRIPPTTLDTDDFGQYGTSEDGKDLSEASLHTASKEGDTDVVKLLLERGADINSLGRSINSPLMAAASEGKADVVRLLIERGAKVDLRDREGWTALILASRYGHLEALRVLIDHGANVNARKRDYWTPMHLSAGNGHVGIVKLLLEHGGDVHAVNEEGQKPYEVAQQAEHREIADLLKENAAGRAR